MNKSLREYSEKFDALSLRERVLITLSVLVSITYLWWMYLAEPVMVEYRLLQQQNTTLESEIESLELAANQVEQRIRVGVHQSKQQQLQLMQAELDRVNQVLREKTLGLVQPDDMFALMRDMIFRDSRLKLTALKRKSVQPAFEQTEAEAEAESETGEEDAKIYRHVMTIAFQGNYRDILNYIERLEKLRWKLIWDRISLKTAEYPKIDVEIEISTLSDTDRWVGL